MIVALLAWPSCGRTGRRSRHRLALVGRSAIFARLLVPVFALYLLWLRRDQLDLGRSTANWLGLGLLGLRGGAAA